MDSEGLKQLIIQIREALEAADKARQSAEKPALFELESMELEVKFTVADSGTRKGGFDFKIVALGTEGTVRSEEVQTLRLKYRVAPQTGYEPLPGTRFHGARTGEKGASGTDVLE